MASAFPTLSPTASTVRKSFFDTPIAGGVSSIFGNALVAIYPLNERKGKVRNCYVTVHSTLFEVHKSQKDAKNKKAAKYLVDFGDVFNVCVQQEPVQIKGDCVCIMDPSTSFFIRPTDSDYDLQAWFDWILERSRECRSTKLLRPVFREEFFEVAWDVQIIRRPKLRHVKRQASDSRSEDLAEKRPQMMGHRRLCICTSSFLLFTIGCRPSSNVDAPFEKTAFVDLPLNVISNYGTQERFFFVRIGRCSEIGGGELWMATEHGASARAMHERISQINQRESERRRAQGIKMNIPTISSSVLKSRAHRERSQTQNQASKEELGLGARGRAGGGRSATAGDKDSASMSNSRKVSTASGGGGQQQQGESKQQCGELMSNGTLGHGSGGGGGRPIGLRPQSARVDSINCLQSIPERQQWAECHLAGTSGGIEGPSSSAAGDQQPNATPASSKKNSIAGILAFRFGAKMSTGSVGKSGGGASSRSDQQQPSSPCAGSGRGAEGDISYVLDGNFPPHLALGSDDQFSSSSFAHHFAAQNNQLLLQQQFTAPRNSLVGSVLGLKLSRKNSGKSTGRSDSTKKKNRNDSSNNNNQQQHKRQQSLFTPQNSFSGQPAAAMGGGYNCAEDYMSYDVDERNEQQQQQLAGPGCHSLYAPSGSVGSRISSSTAGGTGATNRKGSGSTGGGGHSGSSSMSGPMRQFSTSSGGGAANSPDPPFGHPAKGGGVQQGDYLEMGAQQQGGGGQQTQQKQQRQPPAAEPVFSLHEVQSYISNSSESCWTPGSNNTIRSGELVGPSTAANNPPRAYSLGSRFQCISPANSLPFGSGISGSPVGVSGTNQQAPPVLLQPNANNNNESPPNYLRKSILGQTSKNMRAKCAPVFGAADKQQMVMAGEKRDKLEKREEKQQKEEEGVGESQQRKREENGNESPLAMEAAVADMRKRAHSVGSKIWVKPSLRKLSAVKRAAQEEELGLLTSADIDSSRRNTSGNKSMGSGSSCYPHSMEDHVEIDFDREESPSMDSIPSLQSRNSSIGVQMSSGVRSALDSLGGHSSRDFCASAASGGDKPSERLVRCSKGGGRNGVQMERKQSEPELLHHHGQQQNYHCQPMESAKPSGNNNNNNMDQNRLHPAYRRSTYDGPTAALRMANHSERRRAQQQMQMHGQQNSGSSKSPPRMTAQMAMTTGMALGEQQVMLPSSQSTSSGISSRSTESSATERQQPLEEATKADEEDNDYVMLSTPKCSTSSAGPRQPREQQQNQHQLGVRCIGTIQESTSPGSSSISSADGEGKRRSRQGARQQQRKISSSTCAFVGGGGGRGGPAAELERGDFPDDYFPMVVGALANGGGGQQPQQQRRPQPASASSAFARPSSGSRSSSSVTLQLQLASNREGSDSGSRSVSHSPRPRRKNSGQPLQARSYFPVLQHATSFSPERRKTSAASLCREKKAAAAEDEGNPRKLTCPILDEDQIKLTDRLNHNNRREEARTQGEWRQQNCDYAFIGGGEE